MTRARWVLLAVALLANLLVMMALVLRVSYAPRPSSRRVANGERYALPGAFDVLGRTVSTKEARELLATEAGARELSPAAGAIPLTGALVEEGRRVFYEETFGNELFLTDVLGLLDGGITPWALGRALFGLAGRGTSNLEVRLEKDVAVGEHVFRKGTVVSTGLDVPRGSFFPLGLRFFYDRGRIRAGFTCALCHATVDADSGLVLEGAPNADLNAGLLLALASNSAAYYLHTDVDSLDPYFGDESTAVRSSEGVYEQLPEADRFEQAVSGMFVKWPPGSFDATADGVSNPTSIPDVFAAHGEPFGWSGFAALGPFRGLSAVASFHGALFDPTALAPLLSTLQGVDAEVYLAVLLQRAANPNLRFEPLGERLPSQVLDGAKPSPDSPGLGRFAALPTFPRPSYVSVSGLVPARDEEPVGFAVNALSAFLTSLEAPPRYALNADGIERGHQIFQAAGCDRCHGGPAFTNHRVIPVAEVGTEPSRAKALGWSASSMAPPSLFALDTPFPVPPGARLLPIPVEPEERELLRLAWAHESDGGYKVKGLVGLEWSAPYLHDGGVAVGTDPVEHVGIPGTFGRGVLPEPRNSLRALFDRTLRARVIAANEAVPALGAVHVTGRGHPYWVDVPAGFSALDQEALLDYLLSLREVALRGFRGATNRP